ncbi:MAG: hypothetical protein NZM38_05745 [Cytophagales bacterium]|nr:hypothetical protein [Cytophagales bacterium]MDW8384258.1 hypothetical protein [Flammeovirgaceae bacterium]
MWMYIAFLSFYAWITKYYSSRREALIVSSLVWSGLIIVSTEFFSALKWITPFWIRTFWIIVTSVNVLLIWQSRKSLKGKFTISIPSQYGVWEKSVILFMSLLVALLFYQGLYYAPNNYDSMTYHLARVMRWTFQKSVSHYATHIPRQLSMPPFAEFVALHSFLLHKSDVWFNSIQLFYLLLTCCGVSLIAKTLGGNAHIQLYSAFVALTFPMSVLQATSTQNDLVTGCFLVITYWLIIQIWQKPISYFPIWLGTAAGLLTLTKGVSFIWLVMPALVTALVLILHLTKHRINIKSFLIVGLSILLPTVLLPLPHFLRNFHLFGNILGTTPEDQKLYACEEYTFNAIYSNIIKNISLHFKEPFIDNSAEWIVKKIIPENYLNNPVNTFPGLNFELRITEFSEDYASSFLATLLVLVGLLCLPFFIKKIYQNKPLFFYVVSILISGLLFCAMIKWNPWATRLHISLFLLASPLIGFLLFKIKYLVQFLGNTAIVFISIYALLFSVFNRIRPLVEIENVTHFVRNKPRYERHFPSHPQERIDTYKNISSFLADKDSIGIIIGADSWEYPLYTADFSALKIPRTVCHVNVENLSKILEKPTLLNFIITESANTDSLKYGTNTYFRIRDHSLKTLQLFQRDSTSKEYVNWVEKNKMKENLPKLIAYMRHDIGVLMYYKQNQQSIGKSFEEWLPSSAEWHYQNKHQSPYFVNGELQDYILSFKEPDEKAIKQQLINIMKDDEGVKQYYAEHSQEIGKSFENWLPDAAQWHLDNKDKSNYFKQGQLIVAEKETKAIFDFVTPVRQKLGFLSLFLAILISLTFVHNFCSTIFFQ